ncbi:hypothetical protein [Streptomyces rubiginosohelvolus]|uniref:hypothetical protein n=1 Tax=Streptomyces rubiginosohelvolus TaxID=67362 RepID=UPI003449C139
MNPAIKPFVSSQDISKGERGLGKIANELQGSAYGIVCVTRENQAAPWINFESGALSRELDESMLAPFLLDLSVRDLSGPIAQFQATESASQEDVWALVKGINSECEESVEGDRLEVVFNRFWGDLDADLREVRSAQSGDAPPGRDIPEILDELVSLVRDQTMRIHKLEERFESVRVANTSHNYTINDPQQVTIEVDELVESRKERALRQDRFIAQVRKLLGPSNVLGVAKTSKRVAIVVNRDGLNRAQLRVHDLQELASMYLVWAVIEEEGKGQRNRVILNP